VPDARAAIIRAYGRFEHALAAARAPRAPWQTPAEFMRTTLARLPVPVPPVERLTALFEIARFSNRPVDAQARDTACDCLDEINAALDTEPPPV
jgi:AcrR family transcriptional regulator